LIAAGVAVGLVVTGCGGGSNQQDNQSQGSRAEQSKQERTGGKNKEEATKMESLAGTVLKVVPDGHTVLVRPKDGDRQIFRYNPDKVKVTLDGKEAGPDAIDKGQRIRVGYVKVTTKKDREVNVARSIKLQSKKGKPGGETTG